MSAQPRDVLTPTTPPITRSRIRTAAWVLLCANIALQIAFPLTGGGTTTMTTASVGLMSLAMLADATAGYGARSALVLAIVAGGGGLLAETVGVHTGFPFGMYSYTGALQPEVLGVPVAVPAAWIMMSWPAFLVARRLCGRARWAVIPVGAYALTAWDVFLDPQMVDRGYWRWVSQHPALPGVDGIPLSNFGGWLLVSAIMMALLTVAIPRRHGGDITRMAARPDTVAVVAYLWTYFSSVVAHLLFFGRPTVAVVGGLVMGLVAIPLALSLVEQVRGDRR